MRINIFVLLAVSVILFYVGVYFFNITTGNVLFSGAVALSIVLLVLVTVPEVFTIWKKFSLWYVSLAILLFIFYPKDDYFLPDPEQVYWLISILYLIINFVLILISLSKKRRNNNIANKNEISR